MRSKVPNIEQISNMASRIVTLFLFTSLFSYIASGDDNCNDYEQRKKMLCTPIGPPTCKENDVVVGCANELVSIATRCGERDLPAVKASAEAIKMIQKVTCASKDIQNVFDDEDCWEESTPCGVKALQAPLQKGISDKNSEVCKTAVKALYECTNKIDGGKCPKKMELNGTLFHGLVDESKCLTGSAAAIKMAVHIILFALFTLLVAL